MIDFSKQHYYSPAVVRHAFAAHGIRLYSGDPMDGMSWFSDAPRPFTADTLQVLVGPRRGRGSWGPKLEPYDERFGNVMVTYGGNDERLLARVKAAVDDFALGTVSRP